MKRSGILAVFFGSALVAAQTTSYVGTVKDLALNTDTIAAGTCADIRRAAFAGGAKCDWNGTTGTDDTAAIQAAVNTVACVHIPALSCRITAPIVLPSTGNILIEGEGQARSTLVNTANTDAIHSTNTHLFTLRDFEILDGISGTRTSGDALKFSYSSGSVEANIERLQIGGHMNGVNLANTLKTNISRVRVTSCKSIGFLLNAGSSTSTTYDTDYANGCGGSGFYATGALAVTYVNAASDGNGGCGFELNDAGGSVMNVHFSGTDAEQNATKGYCLNGTGYIAGITFSAANAGANTSDGIYLKGANHITFQSGVSTANHGYGLNIGSGVSDLFDLGYSYTTSSVSNSLGAWNDPNNALAYRIYHPICVNQNSSLVSCPTSTAYGEQNAFGWTVAGNSAAGRSYGLLVKAGTGSADIAAQIQAADGTNLFSVRGDGLTTIKGNTVPQINGASSSGLVCWKASGALGTCTAGTFPTCTTCN